MPPDVVGEPLRSAVALPGAQHFEAFVVQQGDAARPVRTVRAAQAGQEHAVGAAVECVRTRVSGLGGQLLGLDRFDEAGAGGIGVGVEDVQPGGAQSRNDQVAPRSAVMTGMRQRARAGVPAEVVQFVAQAGQLDVGGHAAVHGGFGVGADREQGIRALCGRVEPDDIGELLPGCGDRVRRSAVQGGVPVVVAVVSAVGRRHGVSVLPNGSLDPWDSPDRQPGSVVRDRCTDAGH